MAGIQLRLQKELFTPANEQLHSFLHCIKVSSEKKVSKTKDIYLCIVTEASNQQGGFQLNISLCEVKGSDGPQDLPRKKKSWSIIELKKIDGKFVESLDNSRDKNVSEDNNFELVFGEKAFNWSAINFEEKKKFLSTLVNLCARRVRKIELVNLPPGVILEDVAQNQSHASIINRDIADGETYQAINDHEAADLLALMNNCEHAITNADLFVEDLSRQLDILDGDNIYSIMASGENIDHLMKLLETSISHAEKLESRLNQYDELLENIRDSMDKMGGKTGNFEIVNINNKRLLNVLETVVTQLDLSGENIQILTEPDFSPLHLRKTIRAASAIERTLLTEIDPSLMKLSAVIDRRKRCERLRDKFSKSVFRHFSNVFVSLGNETDRLDISAGGAAIGELKLTRRRTIHKDLLRYAELVHWMKAMDSKGFNALQSSYRTSLSKLYDKDIKKFFENARFKISGNKLISGANVGSSQNLSEVKKAGSKHGNTGQGGLLGNDTDSLGSEISTSERERFDDVTETILIEFESVCRDEQSFSTQFFKMETRSPSAKPDPKRDKILMEEARNMMAEIFPSLESELLQFVSTYEKLDSFFTMNALVRLSKHVLSAQDTGSFLAISLGTVLVQVKRNFDKFMQQQLKSIEESKVPRRSKCGILPFITNFEKFVETTESIFRNSERRSDLEKWYGTLVGQMVSTVTRLAREHSKTPSEVIKMENFHHLFALLSRMKITSLDTIRKEIKNKYSDALKNYVTQYFGRPLEKLTQFFDGIQSKLSSGIKESEIGYQLDFSKQELRKVIAIYPGREVKKGLDNLYKKVERHLCDEENLIQVVWRSMQEEFITQYKCIEDLIQRCYPGSQISLDFAIDDVLHYFSDIARSH